LLLMVDLRSGADEKRQVDLTKRSGFWIGEGAGRQGSYEALLAKAVAKLGARRSVEIV